MRPPTKRKKTRLSDAPDVPPEDTSRHLQTYLSEDEWMRLLHVAQTTKKGMGDPQRNEVLLLVMYELGLRREEPGVLRLSYADRLHKNFLYVWRGKGSRSDYYELSQGTAYKLSEWIHRIYPRLKSALPIDYIFPGKGKSGGLTGRAVYKIFNRSAELAKLKKNARHPHILKRTRCQHLLNAAVEVGLSADVVYQTLAKLIGHETALTTIKHYTTETETEKLLVKDVTARLTQHVGTTLTQRRKKAEQDRKDGLRE